LTVGITGKRSEWVTYRWAAMSYPIDNIIRP